MSSRPASYTHDRFRPLDRLGAHECIGDGQGVSRGRRAASALPRTHSSQFGSPDELPNIHHLKEYEATRTDELPDYRITCIFVDRDYRRRGVAGMALRGALDLIAKVGGGVVEGYPHDLQQGEKMRPQFLYNTTRSLYEQTGFSYDRPKGKKNCVMRTIVSPAEAS